MLAAFRLGVIAAAVRVATGAPASPGDASYGSLSLLLHGEGANGSTTILDSSPYAHAITRVSPAAISTAQLRFGVSSIGLGNGGYLTIPSNAAIDLTTGDFTVEAWARFGFVNVHSIVINRGSATGNYPYQIWMNSSAAGGPKIGARAVASGGGLAFDLTGTTTVVAGVWYHLALTRSGSSIRLFVNGALEASATFSGSFFSGTLPVAIGAYDNGVAPMNGGFVDEVRITKGAARYTAPFTPPTLAFPDEPASSFLSLLLHLNGANNSTTFTDSSPAARSATVFGDAKITTAQFVFGGASATFDGAGDYLSFPSSTDFDLGTVYTVEFWVRFDDVARQAGLVHRGLYSTIGTSWTGLTFSIRQLNNYLRCYFFATSGASEQYIDTSSIPFSAGVWYHVAMVRNGTTGQVFINGASAGTISGLNTPGASSQPLIVGDWLFDVTGTPTHQYLSGQLDEVRILKGVARYLAPFPVPTSPFPDA